MHCNNKNSTYSVKLIVDLTRDGLRYWYRKKKLIKCQELYCLKYFIFFLKITIANYREIIAICDLSRTQSQKCDIFIQNIYKWHLHFKIINLIWLDNVFLIYLFRILIFKCLIPNLNSYSYLVGTVTSIIQSSRS